LFSGAFTADALRALWPGNFTEWMARNRDRFVLGFAASHTVHLGAIIALMTVLGRVPIARLIPGGLVFLLIYALAAIAIARAVSQKQLARIGSSGFESFAMYTIWLVFASAFVPRMVKGWPIYSVLGVLALAAVLLRVAGRARKVRAVAA